MTVSVFWYLVSISTDFYVFYSPLVLDSIEGIYQTLEGLRSSSKILRFALYFQTLFSMVGNVFKHILSCLIYHIQGLPALNWPSFIVVLLSTPYLRTGLSSYSDETFHVCDFPLRKFFHCYSHVFFPATHRLLPYSSLLSRYICCYPELDCILDGQR